MNLYEFGILLEIYGVESPPECRDAYARYTYPRHTLVEKMNALYGKPIFG